MIMSTLPSPISDGRVDCCNVEIPVDTQYFQGARAVDIISKKGEFQVTPNNRMYTS